MIFDFVNGFHDAANSIATVVATRVLKPWQAVIWAAFWNFIAFAYFRSKVANEIAKIIDSNVVSIGLVFAGLVARSSGTWSRRSWGCRRRLRTP